MCTICVYQSEGGGPGTDYLSSCVWADGGDSRSAVLRNPARWADGGDFRKPVSSQSKVLPDRNNSIQSPTGPQKFNPKSYQTAKIQNVGESFAILFYTCHLKDEKYEMLANVSQYFYILATLRTTNTKCWRKFRIFFIYLPP